ncbi:MAG: SMI1/KNR4 family protein [Ktedonobacterales bacterium]
MSNNQAREAIFQRIREHCREQNWYGPDGDLPIFRWRVEHGASQEYSPAPTQGFDFPPVTEEQLAETEEVLEFALPPALRTLYSSVANGGFGPGYGVIGAIGGFGPGDGVYEIAQGFYAFSDETQLVPLEAYAEAPGAQRFLLPDDCWPDRLLPLCYWGCAMYDFIDASTGRICQREITDPVYHDSPSWQDPRRRLIITRTELSLEDWLTRWLDGSLESPQS